MTTIPMLTTRGFHQKRVMGATLVAALCVLLTACILMPGKFASTLDVRKDGHFTFAYKGEIHFVSPADLDDKKGGDAAAPAFEPEPCTTATGATRKCSTAEIDAQTRAWQERQEAEESAKKAQMTAMMGTEDLSDPKSAEEFARKLARQKGWRSVKSMGKGRFDVDYEISGVLTHDFTFPVMEDFPLANPFVQVMLREDGTARIKAPGFSSGASGSPLKSLAQIGAMDESQKGKDKPPQLPRMEGIFTVTTDGEILANNTDEGPRAGQSGSQLVWTVNDRTGSQPAALVRLAR